MDREKKHEIQDKYQNLWQLKLKIVSYKVLGSDDYAEATPVPIPNTAVKLCSAQDTWLVTARENRKLLPQILQCWENANAFSQCWYYIYVVSHSAVQLEFFRLRPVDEERRKNSEETRRISNEGEKGDYVSDRGWRRFKSYLNKN